MKAQVIIIVAYTADRAIGRDNGLICRVSADMQRFKRLTMGNIIIMGRNTFESLPKGALPGRLNVVLSTTRDDFDGAVTFKSLDDALNAFADYGRDIYIIGGGSVYRQALPLADRICATEILCDAVEADTFFPMTDASEWEATDIGPVTRDDKSGVEYRFVDYVRRRHDR